MPSYTLSIVGAPEPQGSMKCVGKNGFHQLIPDNKAALKVWRRLVKAAGEALVRRSGIVAAGPVLVELTVTLDRPATVKPASRRWPWMQSPNHGDVDKLARAVMDGLAEGLAYANDAQVCELHVRKVYPDTLMSLVEPEPWSWSTPALTQPGATVRVRSLE